MSLWMWIELPCWIMACLIWMGILRLLLRRRGPLPWSRWKQQRSRSRSLSAMRLLTPASGGPVASSTTTDGRALLAYLGDSSSAAARISELMSATWDGRPSGYNRTVELLYRAMPKERRLSKHLENNPGRERAVMGYNDSLRDPEDAKAWFLRAFELTL